jgi:hypothetical protein
MQSNQISVSKLRVLLCSGAPLMAALLFSGGSAGCQTAAAGRVVRFADLPPGDEVQMSFITSGCFHYRKYELRFVQSTNLTVTIDSMGPLPLTIADAEGLDRLLQFYRSKPPMDCTTVDRIQVVLVHDGKMVVEERFKDGSCQTHLGRDEGALTTVVQLIDRLPKSQP